MIASIIIGIVALSIILIIHELGHFIAAKATGVRVEEFGLGLPPRIFGKKLGETIYSINAIPFGGFNRMTGEEDPSDPRSLAGKSRRIRLTVLSAGSLMNFLLAFVLFSIIFMLPHDAETGQIVIEEVAPDSPAAVSGIVPKDIILSINNQPVDSGDKLSQYIEDNLGKEITITIQHTDSTKENIQLTPRQQPPEGEGAVGIAFRTINRSPFWQAIPRGANRLYETVVLWVQGLIDAIKGEVKASFVGPVGIVQLTGEVASAGVIPLLDIIAVISLILGICNLFPIPAVDGGRLFFIFLEWVRRGKRVKPKTEAMIHAIGFIMLLIFMFAVTYQDILRIIRGENFFS
jgi:regulator of sigma E protease